MKKAIFSEKSETLFDQAQSEVLYWLFFNWQFWAVDLIRVILRSIINWFNM